MPYDADSNKNFSLISPIPIRATVTRSTANELFTMMADSPRGLMSSVGWVSPPSPQMGHLLRHNIQNDKMSITAMQRSEMSRQIYHIIRYHLPSSIRNSTTVPQLLLISRAIEKKLYQGVSSYYNYLDESTLKLRITALACAVLIHSEKGRSGRDGNSTEERSDTCSRLLAVARSSLPHCIMVLVLYETRELDKRFATVASGTSSEDDFFSL